MCDFFVWKNTFEKSSEKANINIFYHFFPLLLNIAIILLSIVLI